MSSKESSEAFLHFSNIPPYFHCVVAAQFSLVVRISHPTQESNLLYLLIPCPEDPQMARWHAHFNTAIIAPVAESTSLLGSKTSGSRDPKVTEVGGKQNVH